MADSAAPLRHRAPPEGKDPLNELAEAIRDLQPKRRPVRHALAWLLAVCATPVIASYAVPSAQHMFNTASCYAKYWTLPGDTRIRSSAWQPFGATSVKPLSRTSVSIKPAAAGDIWFGATMPFTRYCDYRVTFSAELLRPIQANAIGQLGFGYGVGARGVAINGVPSATTVQYDPPFGGLRTVPIPCCANNPGYNPQQIPGIVAGKYHRWTLTVIASTAYVSLDGKGYGSITLGHGNDILIRVWNAKIIVTDMEITALRP